ncbi:hypothetical protein O181_119590 [Austropuccinia psidii MF-1]|uniref:Uncharacterized protein n=1 Tax=Austropuccinia psidii MF-1 TaxID=1389203 RepID=A0A9Q3Q0I2_9BASI|nr:hypothetical protein [Austropuccinia psidii MF-1]
MSWFLKKKKGLTALHPDMSETTLHKKISRKCGGGLEHGIRRRCIKPSPTEDYNNSMKDITTKTKTGRNRWKPLIDNKNSWKKNFRPNKPQDKATLKWYKCGSTSCFANNFRKRKRTNEIEVEKAEETKERIDLSLHESDSEPPEEGEFPDKLSIANINVSFEVTEVHCKV